MSALFDDVYGFILTILGQPAFTGTLTIRYEQGVPIHEPLECRVRLDGREGRKLLMSGELTGVGPDGDADGLHAVDRGVHRHRRGGVRRQRSSVTGVTVYLHGR